MLPPKIDLKEISQETGQEANIGLEHDALMPFYLERQNFRAFGRSLNISDIRAVAKFE